MATFPRLAALAVVLSGDRVLLVRRRNEPDADIWGFPGGHVDPGETVADCAVRELAEETGVTAIARRFLTGIDVIRRNPDASLRFHFVLAAVACDYLAGDPAPADDVLDARWVAIADIRSAVLPLSRHVDAVVALALGPQPAGDTLLVDIG